MSDIVKTPLSQLGYGFVPPEFLPEGENEYYLRDTQQFNQREYRHLTAKEVETLVKNENTADDWNQIFVSRSFDPDLVKDCHFHGLVRIGDLEPFYLEYHDLRQPVGLYSSSIVSCDIGSNVAIHNARYLAHYVIGDGVILFNIDEMHTTNHAKFGNGIVKDGEDESVRIWLEIWNEMAGRRVIPFDGMIPADAYLWAKYRGDQKLMDRFKAITDARFDKHRGYYGTVGSNCVIKHCRIIKDVAI
ncbi:DUF4954 family protein, partial [bacterium]|nr:DUF4954 family protein [bacterium]